MSRLTGWDTAKILMGFGLLWGVTALVGLGLLAAAVGISVWVLQGMGVL